MLIFVHSRKETYKTAKFLQEEAMRNDDLAKFMPQNAASREILQVSLVHSRDEMLALSPILVDRLKAWRPLKGNHWPPPEHLAVGHTTTSLEQLLI